MTPSLRRRLLVLLLGTVLAAWLATALFTYVDARHEIGEMLDAHLAQSAGLVAAQLEHEIEDDHDGAAPRQYKYERKIAFQVWDRKGRLVLRSASAPETRLQSQSEGYGDAVIDGKRWRIFSRWDERRHYLVQVAERYEFRDELAQSVASHLLHPLYFALPALALLVWLAVGAGLAPLAGVAHEVARRDPDNLAPLDAGRSPREVLPLVAALNALFGRLKDSLEQERRFTADAAHELRTPLAVLHAQWDVLRRAADGGERAAAAARLDAGFDRIERLVEQLLVLSRVEASAPAAPASVDWPPLVEQVMSDVLPLAERRRIELACDWPPEGELAFPLQGQPELLAVLLRNLLDNAVRYAPEGGTATLRFTAAGLEVENDGPPLPAETRAHLGERFHRQAGQAESGSGLGVSIVLRIAALHGLAVHYGTRADGQGVRAEVKRAMVDAAVQAGPAGLAGPHVSAA